MKVAGPQNSNFIKKRLQHRFFSVKFANMLRTSCCTDLLQWLLLTVSGFQPVSLLKERLSQIRFSVNFEKLLTAYFDKTPRDDCSCIYLWVLKSFSQQLVYRAPMGNCLFHVQVAKFQPPDIVYNYFISAFRAFHTRRPFEDLNLLKIPETYV